MSRSTWTPSAEDKQLTKVLTLPMVPDVMGEHGFARPRAPTDGHSKILEHYALFDSVTSLSLSSALDGLALRQRAIANNIANVNTPGYQARRVQFESALASSVGAGNGRATASTSHSLEPTRLDGSNVNLDTETLSNIDTVLRYQFVAQAASGPYTSIRTALRSS